MKKFSFALLAAVGLACMSGCGMHVDITKTAKGFSTATNPNDVEILMMRPNRPFVELGSVTVFRADPSDIARLHNAIRAKAAPLGADAVVLLTSGLDQNSYLWATGAAIKYQDK